MNRDEYDAQQRMTSVILEVLGQYPNLAGVASMAITEGVTAAHRAAQLELSGMRIALSAALGLASKDRLSAETKAALNTVVLRALPDPEHRNGYEREFVEAQEQDMGYPKEANHARSD